MAGHNLLLFSVQVLSDFMSVTLLLGFCHTSQQSSERSGWTCPHESLGPECKQLQSRWLQWWPTPPGAPPSGQPACGWVEKQRRDRVTDIIDCA